MPTVYIEKKNVTVEFPEGMSEEDIRKEIIENWSKFEDKTPKPSLGEKVARGLRERVFDWSPSLYREYGTGELSEAQREVIPPYDSPEAMERAISIYGGTAAPPLKVDEAGQPVYPGVLESALAAAGSLGEAAKESVKGGFARFGVAAAYPHRALGGLTGIEPWKQYGQEWMDYYGAKQAEAAHPKWAVPSKDIGEFIGRFTDPGYLASNVPGVVTTTLPTAAAYIAGAPLSAVVGIAALLEGSGAYAQSLAQGDSDIEALNKSLLYGVPAGLLETWGIKSWAGGPAGRRLIKRIFGGFLGEGGTERLQAWLETLVVKERLETPEEAWAGWEAGGLGALVGVGGAVGVGGITGGVRTTPTPSAQVGAITPEAQLLLGLAPQPQLALPAPLEGVSPAPRIGTDVVQTPAGPVEMPVPGRRLTARDIVPTGVVEVEAPGAVAKLEREVPEAKPLLKGRPVVTPEKPITGVPSPAVTPTTSEMREVFEALPIIKRGEEALYNALVGLGGKKTVSAKRVSGWDVTRKLGLDRVVDYLRQEGVEVEDLKVDIPPTKDPGTFGPETGAGLTPVGIIEGLSNLRDRLHLLADLTQDPEFWSGQFTDAERTGYAQEQLDLLNQFNELGLAVQQTMPILSPEQQTETRALFEETRQAATEAQVIVKTQLDRAIAARERGEEGFALLPSWENFATRTGELKDSIRDFGQSLHEWVDVMAKWEGYPKTGHSVMNYYTRIASVQDQGIKYIRESAQELGDDPQLLRDAAFGYEDSVYREHKMTPEARRKLKPFWDRLFTRWQDHLKFYQEHGGLKHGFKENLLWRLGKRLVEAQEKVDRRLKKGGKKLAVAKQEVKDIGTLIKRAKGLTWLHIPPMYFEQHMLRDPSGSHRVLAVAGRKRRKHMMLADLVEEGVLDPNKVNILDIIAAETRRFAGDVALLEIVQAAKEEGVAIPREGEYRRKRPDGYVRAPDEAPVLRRWWVRPQLADEIHTMVHLKTPQNVFAKMRRVFKFGQFYNPLFLPTYSSIQGVGLGLTWPHKGFFEHWAKGLSDVFNRTDDFYKAYDDGLFPQPYNVPHREYMKSIEWAKANGKERLLMTLHRILPHRALFSAYKVAHGLAWELDKCVRMAGHNYYKDLHPEISNRESAQRVAEYMGNYARVPRKTARELDWALFTPIFKISMGRLQAGMIRSAVKSVPKMLKGEPLTTRQKTDVGGLLRVFTMMMAFDILMRSLGFRAEDWLWKYKKDVQTSEGPKELVVAWSHPWKIGIKYIHRIKRSFRPEVENVWIDLAKKMKWEVQPIFRTSWESITGVSATGKAIWLPMDSAPVKVARGVLYSLTHAAPMLQAAGLAEPEFYDPETEAVMRNEVGRIMALLSRPFVGRYLRGNEAMRNLWGLYKIEEMWKATEKGMAKEGLVPTDAQIRTYIDRLTRFLEATGHKPMAEDQASPEELEVFRSLYGAKPPTLEEILQRQRDLESRETLWDLREPAVEP